MLTAAERDATAAAIEAVQCPDGFVPWFPGGHGDPWNHVEAAMALATAGRTAAAERAYAWLAATQRADGAWHQYYLPGDGLPGDGLPGDGLPGGGHPGGGRRAPRVEVALLDANVSAYVATGTWHHFLTTGDRGFLEAMFPVVERAVGFVLGLQRPGGEVVWARHPDGTPWSFALLTASSSTYQSLRAAVAAAAALGRERPRWATAADRLRAAVAGRPSAFLPKDRWSMDWYYPVLVGAVVDGAARARLESGWGTFVLPGRGVRCVADKPWVTASETAECALALVAAGRPDDAGELLAWTRHLRAEDGSYFTGMVHPEGVHFPAGERTTYTAAAVVLAAAAVADPWSPAARALLGGRGRRPGPAPAPPAAGPGSVAR